MKIVIAADNADIGSLVSPIFGRCSYFVFVDTDAMKFLAIENPAKQASGGAGIKAAQFVIDKGARAVIAGGVGPNAAKVLKQSDTPIFISQGESVSQTAKMFVDGKLNRYHMD